jgi:hypothetical protein
MAKSQLSFETPAYQDMSLGAEEFNSGTEASELLSAVLQLPTTLRNSVMHL